MYPVLTRLAPFAAASSGFGFADALARLGVERRLYTAGARKAALDPFLPPQPGAVARRDAMLRDVHAAFAAVVLQRRGEALRRCGVLGEEDACSGEVWTGAEAARNGMVDAVGDIGPTLRRLYGQVARPRRMRTRSADAAAPRCDALRLRVASGGEGLRRAQLRRATLAARPAGADSHAARGHAAGGGAPGICALHALMPALLDSAALLLCNRSSSCHRAHSRVAV